MKIDLHAHTRERSRCARNTAEEQIAAAIAAGLDALAITDHAALVPGADLLRLNALNAPFRIFGGIELNVDDEDWVILGVQDERLMNERWTYPTLHEFVRQQDGFIFLPHPFRYHPDIAVDLSAHKPDGIELRSSNTPVAAAAQIRQTAAAHGIQLLCNSDAHTNRAFGLFYNIIADDPGDDAALVQALRKGVTIVPDYHPEEPA